MNISDEEFSAMAQIIRVFAVLRREDVIGAFMLTGGFKVLNEEQLLNLAKKIEDAPKII